MDVICCLVMKALEVDFKFLRILISIHARLTYLHVTICSIYKYMYMLKAEQVLGNNATGRNWNLYELLLGPT